MNKTAIDISAISTNLHLNSSGIWQSNDCEEISYPALGNESCFLVEDNSFWFKHRNQCITTIVKQFPPVNNGAIFDVGGGNGYVSLGLTQAGFDVVLVEPGAQGAKNAQTRGIEHIVCATTNTAQFKPNTLAAIGVFDVIEHMQDDHAFVNDMQQLLQPEGRIYATVPAYQGLFSEEDELAGHYRRYCLPQICTLLEQNGFEIEYSSYFFRFLPLPILLLRTLPYRLGIRNGQKPAEQISNDHQVNDNIVTKIVNSLLKGELNNLNHHKSMKFGGSCLIVGKKR